jgi:exopolyphosphatase/guanosine-5'-triphosphate,3'-diphosphate pyrophosphatase
MNILRASIDIGSNSVLLLIAEKGPNSLVEKLKRSEITSLGKDLDKNLRFSDESMQATEEAIASYVRDCLQHGIPSNEIIITATEAARVAKNSGDFFSNLENRLSIKIHVISSQAEAYFSAKGILLNNNFDTEVVTVLDVGGASTEIIKLDTVNFKILDSISMPVGSVRASQWLVENYFVQNLQKVFVDFRSQLDLFQTKKMICVAGTMTSVGNMFLEKKDFHEDDVHGLVLKSEDVDQIFKKYSHFNEDQYLENFPFLGKRSKSIKGGLHLVYHLFHRLLVKEISISTYGLRYGTLIEGQIKEEFLHG